MRNDNYFKDPRLADGPWLMVAALVVRVQERGAGHVDACDGKGHLRCQQPVVPFLAEGEGRGE